ncbi:MAG: alanine racemase [Clostridiales bacterium]|nr:alanine racemase [Clostridiales bacterium]
MEYFNKFVIDADNLKCNASVIKRLLKDKVKLCAVVKANAYGLGVKNVIPIIDEYVDYYAVANIDEGLEVRALNNSIPILILAPVSLNDIDICSANNLTITISDNNYLKALIDGLHSTIKIHIKINTGLNRYGYDRISEFNKALKLIKHNNNIILQGVYTHFATKKDDVEYIAIQKDIFNEYVHNLPKYIIRHCANSFATMLSSTYQMGMVRVGANLYGDVRAEGLALKNVLSIKSRVIGINSVAKGQCVGYDRTYKCNKRSKIAIVPMGYADGINRGLSNKFYVLINGEKAPIVGNICMDCFMVDVSNVDNVYVGSEVVILGEQYNNKITLSDMAKVLNRSSYDILVNFKHKRCEVVIKKEK